MSQTTLTLILTAFLFLAPILVFTSCLYVCIRHRDFLCGSGSLACFMLVIFFSDKAFAHLKSPYQYIAIGVLVASYLWLFFILPFRAGFNGKK